AKTVGESLIAKVVFNQFGSLEADLSGLGKYQRIQETQQGGLSGPVRSEQRHAGSLVDAQAQLANRDLLLIPVRDAIHLEDHPRPTQIAANAAAKTKASAAQSRDVISNSSSR